MKAYTDITEDMIDPTKLADEAVLALSSLEREANVSLEHLEGGIRLCEYLIDLFKKMESLKKEREQWHSSGINYMKAFQDRNNNFKTEIRKSEEVKKWIDDLIKNPSSHSHEEIESIKEYLVTITMPIWKMRSFEFRDRKMKRSLVLYG